MFRVAILTCVSANITGVKREDCDRQKCRGGERSEHNERGNQYREGDIIWKRTGTIDKSRFACDRHSVPGFWQPDWFGCRCERIGTCYKPEPLRCVCHSTVANARAGKAADGCTRQGQKLCVCPKGYRSENGECVEEISETTTTTTVYVEITESTPVTTEAVCKDQLTASVCEDGDDFNEDNQCESDSCTSKDCCTARIDIFAPAAIVKPAVVVGSGIVMTIVTIISLVCVTTGVVAAAVVVKRRRDKKHEEDEGEPRIQGASKQETPLHLVRKQGSSSALEFDTRLPLNSPRNTGFAGSPRGRPKSTKGLTKGNDGLRGFTKLEASPLASPVSSPQRRETQKGDFRPSKPTKGNLAFRDMMK